VGENKSRTDGRFYKRIEDAYIYANKTLLKLMLEEQELIPHLRSAPSSSFRPRLTLQVDEAFLLS